MNNEDKVLVPTEPYFYKMIKDLLSSADITSENGKIDLSNKIYEMLGQKGYPSKTKNLYKLHYESCHHFAVAESIGAADQVYKNNMGLLNEKGFLEISPVAIEKIGDDVNKHLDITDSLILIQD